MLDIGLVPYYEPMRTPEMERDATVPARDAALPPGSVTPRNAQSRERAARLLAELRLEQGPRALRLVLPLARLARPILSSASARRQYSLSPESFDRLIRELQLEEEGPPELRLVLPLARLARSTGRLVKAVVPLRARMALARLRGVRLSAAAPKVTAKPPRAVSRGAAIIGGARPALRAVHQFHAGSATGDAITNAMLLTQDWLRRQGYASEIFVGSPPAELADRLRPFSEIPWHDDYVLIVRHSIGHDLLDQIIALPAPKILIYHNITPPELFADNPGMQHYLELGRRQLALLRPHIVAALADSEYNALELRQLGFDPVRECPFLFDIDAMLARAGAPRSKADAEAFTVLFVGRIVPSKGQADLVEAFGYFHAQFERKSRLVLVGRYDDDGHTGYAGEIRARAARLGIAEHVVLTGLVSDEALHEWYRSADLYVSLSQHEGFGVPLVEAMAHGVPVLAWPAGAVRYTLAGAGELLSDRAPRRVADAMLDLARRPDRRAEVITRQNERIPWFGLEQHAGTLLGALALAGAAPPATDRAREGAG
ncbi:MAG TPA: glycosyltransferase [Xanthobacteraceae bacterium]|nr:glycosyltransferase [Xanthobacteraceae bacterium]